MAYTQSQLETIITGLESKLASGNAEVRFEGRLLRYNSTAEIQSAIRYFQGLLTTQIASDAGTARPSRFTRFQSGKGI